MTQRRRVVPEGYVDEAVIKKLISSFGAVMNECLPTGSEIMTAAVRIIILGLHMRLTNGDPSTTTSKMQARLEKFGDEMRARPNLKESSPDGIQCELKRLYYDTANATSAPTIVALMKLVPPSQITYGSDFRSITMAARWRLSLSLSVGRTGANRRQPQSLFSRALP